MGREWCFYLRRFSRKESERVRLRERGTREWRRFGSRIERLKPRFPRGSYRVRLDFFLDRLAEGSTDPPLLLACA
jgi:hypothetical protein